MRHLAKLFFVFFVLTTLVVGGVIAVSGGEVPGGAMSWLFSTSSKQKQTKRVSPYGYIEDQSHSQTSSPKEEAREKLKALARKRMNEITQKMKKMEDGSE